MAWRARPDKQREGWLRSRSRPGLVLAALLTPITFICFASMQLPGVAGTAYPLSIFARSA